MNDYEFLCISERRRSTYNFSLNQYIHMYNNSRLTQYGLNVATFESVCVGANIWTEYEDWPTLY